MGNESQGEDGGRNGKEGGRKRADTHRDYELFSYAHIQQKKKKEKKRGKGFIKTAKQDFPGRKEWLECLAQWGKTYTVALYCETSFNSDKEILKVSETKNINKTNITQIDHKRA